MPPCIETHPTCWVRTTLLVLMEMSTKMDVTNSPSILQALLTCKETHDGSARKFNFLTRTTYYFLLKILQYLCMTGKAIISLHLVGYLFSNFFHNMHSFPYVCCILGSGSQNSSSQPCNGVDPLPLLLSPTFQIPTTYASGAYITSSSCSVVDSGCTEPQHVDRKPVVFEKRNTCQCSSLAPPILLHCLEAQTAEMQQYRRVQDSDYGKRKQ